VEQEGGRQGKFAVNYASEPGSPTMYVLNNLSS
jgi:hypothetical protein